MNNKPRILLAEDDPNLGLLLREYLTIKGLDVNLCEDGEVAWEAFGSGDYDICIFDVMMPRMDGFTLARKIREENQEIPILFLTAKSMKEDRIEGFKIGADDYITKPFSMEELQLRINAILRRYQTSTQPKKEQSQFDFGAFHFDHKLQVLTHTNGKETRLTSKESDLLKMLCENINDVMEREQALKRIWRESNYFTARSMDVYITKLRRYLKEDPEVEIKNIHGKGYRLIAEEKKAPDTAAEVVS